VYGLSDFVFGTFVAASMVFKFETPTRLYTFEDEGLVLKKDNTEDIIDGACASPCFPRDRPVVAAAIRIEQHTHIDDDGPLWSEQHCKHDMDIGIMPKTCRTSAWLRNVAPGRSAIVSNLSGSFLPQVCD
jgi:hypothetical protein